jgi:formylglycine-generating enzyme required for sulfatase activity
MKNLKQILFLIIALSTHLIFADTENPEQKISKMGAVFTIDFTHPELGLAYKEPSGLIWGDIVIEDNHVLQVNYEDANSYCQSIGARLPTNQEYLQLGKYLGAGTWTGYSVLTKDKEHSMFLALERFWYWSSSAYWLNPKVFQYIYWGDSGITTEGQKKSKGGAIHCVVKN